MKYLAFEHPIHFSNQGATVIFLSGTGTFPYVLYQRTYFDV